MVVSCSGNGLVFAGEQKKPGATLSTHGYSRSNSNQNYIVSQSSSSIPSVVGRLLSVLCTVSCSLEQFANKISLRPPHVSF